MSRLEGLEEKHMMETILFIERNPGCMKTDVYNAVSRNPRMPEKFGALREMGLIEQRRIDNRGTTTLRLTDKGYRVASLLEHVENELESA